MSLVVASEANRASRDALGASKAPSYDVRSLNRPRRSFYLSIVTPNYTTCCLKWTFKMLWTELSGVVDGSARLVGHRAFLYSFGFQRVTHGNVQQIDLKWKTVHERLLYRNVELLWCWTKAEYIITSSLFLRPNIYGRNKGPTEYKEDLRVVGTKVPTSLGSKKSPTIQHNATNSKTDVNHYWASTTNSSWIYNFSCCNYLM